MATLTRLVVDLVTEEELSEARVRAISSELSDNLHVIVVEDEDQPNLHVEKNFRGHVHDNSEGGYCPWCVKHAEDRLNGDIVVENS